MHLVRLSLSFATMLLLGACTQVVEGGASFTAEVLREMRNAEPEMIEFRRQLMAAEAVAFEAGHTDAEWVEADKVLRASLLDSRFAELTDEEQSRAYSGAGWAAMRVGDEQRARDLLVRAIEMNPDNAEDQYWLASFEKDLGNHDAAALALVKYMKRWDVDEDRSKFVSRLVGDMDSQSDARLALLQALFDKQWNPPPLGASDLWYALALTRVQRNQPELARAAIARISSPPSIIRLRSDKRFDSLVDRNAPRFDVKAAADRQVDILKTKVGDAPAISKDAVDLTRAMLQAGQNKAVLEFTGRLLATPMASPLPPDDDIEHRASIANYHADALERLGRVDEALAKLRLATQIHPAGEIAVDQVLNLGYMHCRLGQGSEALAAAQSVEGETSDFGAMIQKLVQQCGAILTNDKASAAEALAYLREHRDDAMASFLAAQLRANLMDEAATTVIGQLKAENTRSDMLYQLQTLIESPPLPNDTQMDARWEQLLARDDVTQAVAAVGRIEAHQIY